MKNSKVIDLAELRRETGKKGTEQTSKVDPMTQEELSKLLGIEQSQVSRYEKNSRSIPLELLVRWLDVLGVRWEDALEMGEKSDAVPIGIDPGSPWKKLKRNCDLLIEYVDGGEKVFKDYDKSIFDVGTLKTLAKELRRKPNIVFTGKFDSGKSRLANGLLGKGHLPHKHQPATRLITYVCHINDRPSWLREEVLILNKKFNFIEDITQMDSLSENLIKDYKVVAGNLETLNEYGTHGGKHEKVKDAKYALVYIESPLLEACNIVDLPGSGASKEEDVERAREGGKVADIVIYTSNSTGFLDAEDFARMQYELSRLPSFEGSIEGFPPLGNLFIVATHANRDKTESQLTEILDTASKRLYDTLSKTWETLSEARGITIDANIIRTRMFTYYAELPQRREYLESRINNFLAEILPHAMYGNLDRIVAEFKVNANADLSAHIEQYQSMIDDLANAERAYDELIKNEPARKERVTKGKSEIIRSIQSYKAEHLNELDRVYGEHMEVAKLEDLIRAKYEKKDDAQRYLGTYLLDQMQGRLGRVGEASANLLKDKIDKFLQIYDISLSPMTTDLKKPYLTIPFDAKGAFLGGLTGLGTIGALAWWVSTMGNLGGYILAAKLTGWLAAIGISVGGGAAMVSFLAAIGGPVTAGIAIALAVGALIWAIFGDSWQKRLARKTIDAFKTNKVKETLNDGIAGFWQATEVAFQMGARNVEDKFTQNLANLENIIKGENSREALENKISQYKGAQDFLAGTPWVPLAR
ncbi:MAG: dynamin family protein [Nitrospirota bacterium]